VPPRAALRPGALQAVFAVAGVGLALSLGLAAGDPTPASWTIAGALLACMAIVTALARPFVALQALAISTILLIVYDLPSGLGLNLFDLLLPCLFCASVLGGAIESERLAEREATDPRALELRRATRRLTTAVLVYYGIAVLSIVVMVLFGRTAPLANSTFTLLRGLQGMLLFPLGLWWICSERQIHVTIRMMVLGVVLLALLNTVGFATGVVQRAGMIWFVNLTEAPIGGPNETASTMLMVLALLVVRQSLADRFRNLALIGLVLATLVATFSRSGLLAFLTFAVLVMPRTRLPRMRLRWVLIAAVVLAAAIPLIPQDYWTRMGRTLVLQRGTFETYSSLIRVYAWKTAWAVFLDNPLLGVGFFAFPYVSDVYGELRLRNIPVDNYYLETAAGTGIVGLVGLAFVLLRLFQLGSVVRRIAPPGSLGHTMARFHAPLLIGMLIVNLTGNNFVGLVVLGQLALWLAMLVRAGHLSLETRGA